MKDILRKLKSVKVWIALWSMTLITFIVIKDLSAFNNLAALALTPIIAYLGANVWQDKIYTGKNSSAKGGKNEV